MLPCATATLAAAAALVLFAPSIVVRCQDDNNSSSSDLQQPPLSSYGEVDSLGVRSTPALETRAVDDPTTVSNIDKLYTDFQTVVATILKLLNQDPPTNIPMPGLDETGSVAPTGLTLRQLGSILCQLIGVDMMYKSTPCPASSSRSLYTRSMEESLQQLGLVIQDIAFEIEPVLALPLKATAATKRSKTKKAAAHHRKKIEFELPTPDSTVAGDDNNNNINNAAAADRTQATVTMTRSKQRVHNKLIKKKRKTIRTKTFAVAAPQLQQRSAEIEQRDTIIDLDTLVAALTVATPQQILAIIIQIEEAFAVVKEGTCAMFPLGPNAPGTLGFSITDLFNIGCMIAKAASMLPSSTSRRTVRPQKSMGELYKDLSSAIVPVVFAPPGSVAQLPFTVTVRREAVLDCWNLTSLVEQVSTRLIARAPSTKFVEPKIASHVALIKAALANPIDALDSGALQGGTGLSTPRLIELVMQVRSRLDRQRSIAQSTMYYNGQVMRPRTMDQIITQIAIALKDYDVERVFLEGLRQFLLHAPPPVPIDVRQSYGADRKLPNEILAEFVQRVIDATSAHPFPPFANFNLREYVSPPTTTTTTTSPATVPAEFLRISDEDEQVVTLGHSFVTTPSPAADAEAAEVNNMGAALADSLQQTVTAATTTTTTTTTTTKRPLSDEEKEAQEVSNIGKNLADALRTVSVPTTTTTTTTTTKRPLSNEEKEALEVGNMGKNLADVLRTVPVLTTTTQSAAAVEAHEVKDMGKFLADSLRTVPVPTTTTTTTTTQSAAKIEAQELKDISKNLADALRTVPVPTTTTTTARITTTQSAAKAEAQEIKDASKNLANSLRKSVVAAAAVAAKKVRTTITNAIPSSSTGALGGESEAAEIGSLSKNLGNALRSSSSAATTTPRATTTTTKPTTAAAIAGGDEETAEIGKLSKNIADSLRASSTTTTTTTTTARSTTTENDKDADEDEAFVDDLAKSLKATVEKVKRKEEFEPEPETTTTSSTTTTTEAPTTTAAEPAPTPAAAPNFDVGEGEEDDLAKLYSTLAASLKAAPTTAQPTTVAKRSTTTTTTTTEAPTTAADDVADADDLKQFVSNVKKELTAASKTTRTTTTTNAPAKKEEEIVKIMKENNNDDDDDEADDALASAADKISKQSTTKATTTTTAAPPHAEPAAANDGDEESDSAEDLKKIAKNVRQELAAQPTKTTTTTVASALAFGENEGKENQAFENDAGNDDVTTTTRAPATTTTAEADELDVFEEEKPAAPVAKPIAKIFKEVLFTTKPTTPAPEAAVAGAVTLSDNNNFLKKELNVLNNISHAVQTKQSEINVLKTLRDSLHEVSSVIKQYTVPVAKQEKSLQSAQAKRISKLKEGVSRFVEALKKKRQLQVGLADIQQRINGSSTASTLNDIYKTLKRQLKDQS